MIKIEKTDVYGWDAAIRGMRNPMNSWDKSDSTFFDDSEGHVCGIGGKHRGTNSLELIKVGDNDIDLMKRLSSAGSVHAKYRRMINVTCDITAPLYWWKEFDTYKVGTVANSCSTMHKIHAKEFTKEDFSWEYLYTPYDKKDLGSEELSEYILIALNRYRERFLETKDRDDWLQMIQLLPSSYNQKRTVQMNYEVLVGMYRDRKNHKLDEWHTFCDWIKELPYSELITLEGLKNENL